MMDPEISSGIFAWHRYECREPLSTLDAIARQLDPELKCGEFQSVPNWGHELEALIARQIAELVKLAVQAHHATVDAIDICQRDE